MLENEVVTTVGRTDPEDGAGDGVNIIDVLGVGDGDTALQVITFKIDPSKPICIAYLSLLRLT